MFGLGKNEAKIDRLTVQVHVLASKEAYELTDRLWRENMRTLHIDESAHKEFLHFGYNKPKCVVWLQRDQGRSNPFELIVRWEDEKMHEVFIISNTGAQAEGDDLRAKAILNSMLITPSIVLSNQ